ncbi:MAG: hypothetical protein NVS3B25_27830 [Hymenobacter sp.]
MQGLEAAAEPGLSGFKAVAHKFSCGAQLYGPAAQVRGAVLLLNQGDGVGALGGAGEQLPAYATEVALPDLVNHAHPAVQGLRPGEEN